MSMPIPHREAILRLRDDFRRRLMLAAGAAATIWVLPIKPRTPNSSLRLLLTLAFFAAAIYALSRLLHPRERYAAALAKWRYAEAPPQVDLLARKTVIREQEVFRSLAMLGMGVLGCGAIGALGSWPQFSVLAPMKGVATMGFIGCVVGLGFMVVSGRSGWGAYQESRTVLREVCETAEFEPRDVRAADAERSRSGPPVATTQEGFEAGGFDWRWDDFHKNAVVFGQPGTGKTVCVLNAVLDGLLSSEPGRPAPGGLILDPKGDFSGKLDRLLSRLGRADDLLVIDPSDAAGTIHWNPLDSDDDELEIAARFAAVLEVLGTKNTQDTFWIDSARKFLRHAIALLRATNPADEPPCFEQVARLCGSLDVIGDRLATIDLADASLDLGPCLDFFEEWAGMGDRTRSSVQAQLTNMIDPFLMQPYRTVFSGRSTMRIGDMIDAGKVLYVSMPIADKEAMSRTICTLVKLEYYREVLKRVDKKRQTFFLCDEFQVFMTAGSGKGDSDFFERSRQSRHANVVACQNMPSLLKQTDQEKSVLNLLSNCAVKVFLRNTDKDTNEFASNMFGQRLVENASASMSSSRGFGKSGEGRSLSVSSEYDHVVRPEAFTRLGIPVRGESDACDSIVHLGSRSAVSLERLRWRVHPI